MRNTFRLSVLSLTVVLVGCVHVPSGPSVMVLPGNGKNFDQFRSDDFMCRQFASQQTDHNTPRSAAISSGAESAAIGTALGAIAGAAFGGGRGAAIGAGSGLLAGGLAGSGSAQSSSSISQERYDVAYIQCMYASGHQVPVSARFNNQGASRYQAPVQQPSNRYIPPPPRGNPPPPPY
ncbi:MAG: glycine zipper family protein [Nitrosomonas sp.]|nr:glycine zipper family protein [Nitrosomonas sp.]